ncbi:MAG: hypothetical protein RI922_2314 [Bacteroidota bacterium]|jgi:hypothetical protein
MKNIFKKAVTEELIDRLHKLTPETPAKWGKMNVAQMLAHCNVTYEMIYEPEKHPKPNGFKRFILKLIVKPLVVSDKVYKENNPTAPAFMIVSEREFEMEKARLIDFLNRTQALGGAHFEGKESNSFGTLKTNEWNAMFYKHLDHHFRQFGV